MNGCLAVTPSRMRLSSIMGNGRLSATMAGSISRLTAHSKNIAKATALKAVFDMC